MKRTFPTAIEQIVDAPPHVFLVMVLASVAIQGVANGSERDDSGVPGVVINYSPAKTRIYLGCASIAVLPNGDYVASHSFFGPGSKKNRSAVFRSSDAGLNWKKLTDLHGQWWSNLFVHKEGLYIMGTNRRWGSVVIRRSLDGGETWTAPDDAGSGLLLADSSYHTAPMPMVVHKGRIWRSMEVGDCYPDFGVNVHPYRSFVMSAPVDADLLKADNWTTSNYLPYDLARVGKKSKSACVGWREGNIVVTPDSQLVNILRIGDIGLDRADVLRISADGKKINCAPARQGFIDFPGGNTKFTIRYDPLSKRYWSLVNKQKNPAATRNILALTSSPDLTHWTVESIILRHPDRNKTAFQYVDWLFEDKDIIAVSRTAFNGAHSFHDANYFTFHRIKHFRKRTLDDPPLNQTDR